MMGALIIAKICCHGCLRTSLFTFSPSQTQVGVHQQHCLLEQTNVSYVSPASEQLLSKTESCKTNTIEICQCAFACGSFFMCYTSSLSEGRLPNAVPANSCQTENCFQYQKWRPYKVREVCSVPICFNNERNDSSCPTLSAGAELISQEWLYGQSHDRHRGCAGFSTKLKMPVCQNGFCDLTSIEVATCKLSLRGTCKPNIQF